MIIREIRLRNFRSYKEETVTLGKGTTLLSGDIGSGKSSLLLAAEFALFGIMRGILSGESLLRSGEDAGEVSLTFSIGSDTVTVRRGLKRKAGSVQQVSGFIIVNGKKEELMPSDLKARIMDILGYPKGLASQHKGLVYRYTVYTPQEEMKQILLEGKEARLDVLRKVFGIERYKAISENAATVNRAVRELIRELEGRTADLPGKLERLASDKKELASFKSALAALAPEIGKAKERFSDRQKAVLALEKQREELLRMKRESDRLDERLGSLIRERTRNNADFLALEKDIQERPKEEPIDIEAMKKKTEGILLLIADLDEKSSGFEKSVGAASSMLRQSSAITSKIDSLDSCPTCEQVVSENHKSLIRSREENKQIQYRKEKEECEKRMGSMRASKEQLKKELENIQSLITKGKIIIEQEKAFQEKEKRKNVIESRNEEIKREIGEVNQMKIAVRNTIMMMEEKGAGYDAAKKSLDEARSDFHTIDKKAGILEQQAKDREKAILILEKEIEEKEKDMKSLSHARSKSRWIEEKFLPAMQAIERTVMGAVFREFNALFTQWFAILIDDENMSVRVDQDFSPVIIQNGYEIDFSALSGGERTSCALAYRLTLNRVINDIIDTIKTRDIIILDEPTDGFSTEQLDRVRDLLDQIRISQVILVSHESKVESFVERIIRVEKSEHVSKVHM